MNGIYEIKVIDEFSGAHNLRNYKGKCEALHGHNWNVEAVLYSGTINDKGMVMDFKDFKEKLKNVLTPLDHKHLNNLPFFKKENPTSENIARFIYDELSKSLPAGRQAKQKLKISVWETANSCASFEK